jgi:peptidoglycan hydrolase-like protein with peptidoglycan-binding domain
MKLKYGVLALTAAGAFAVAPAMAQQGGQQGQQTLTQEQAEGSGTQLEISPATVRQVQQALNQKGYDVGNVDGNWGQETSSAVQNFQQAQGLEPTGNLNMRTLSALGVQLGVQGQAKAPQQGQIPAGGGQGGGQQQSQGGQQQPQQQ